MTPDLSFEQRVSSKMFLAQCKEPRCKKTGNQGEGNAKFWIGPGGVLRIYGSSDCFAAIAVIRSNAVTIPFEPNNSRSRNP